MIKPIRIRLSRKKGFDLQRHSKELNGLPAVSVSRGKNRQWGNPFKVVKLNGCWACQWPSSLNRNGIRLTNICFLTKRNASQCAVDRFKNMFNRPEQLLAVRYDCVADIQDKLKGKNLACWCALDCPCHADALLEIANYP